MGIIASVKKFFEPMSAVWTSLMLMSQVRWLKPSYSTYVNEGYSQNIYVYRCIQVLATTVSGIQWKLYQRSVGEDGNEKLTPVNKGDLLKRLKSPSANQGWGSFIKEITINLNIIGKAFIRVYGPTKSLEILRPDCVKVNLNAQRNEIISYSYDPSGQCSTDSSLTAVKIPPEEILFLHFYHPLDKFDGMPPLMAAARSTDQNNASREWNVALLQNSCRPSGILTTPGSLSEKQKQDIKGELDEKHVGKQNTGRPMIMQGGLTWQTLSMNPSDMHWLEGLKLSALEIATAFGVPAQMIGIPNAQTYANYEQAQKSLYTETVLPFLDELRDEFNRWLLPLFKLDPEKYWLDYDSSNIEALQQDITQTWARTEAGVRWGIISRNEARAILGLPKLDIEGMDNISVPAATVLLTDVVEGTTKQTEMPAGAKPGD